MRPGSNLIIQIRAIGWIPALALCALTAPSRSAPLDPDAIYACQALFHGHRISIGQSLEQMRARQKLEDRAYQRKAKWLARMARTRRATLLASYRRRLRPGSDARTAVAYAAAWYGRLDARLLHEITQPVRDLGPEEQYVDPVFDAPAADTMAYVPSALIRLYRRHPSNDILEEYFHIIRDGEMGEICESTDSLFALEYPESITRFLAHAGAQRSQLGTMVGIDVFAGRPRMDLAGPFLASMRRLAASRDRPTARLARRFIGQVEDARRRFGSSKVKCGQSTRRLHGGQGARQ